LFEDDKVCAAHGTGVALKEPELETGTPEGVAAGGEDWGVGVCYLEVFSADWTESGFGFGGLDGPVIESLLD